MQRVVHQRTSRAQANSITNAHRIHANHVPKQATAELHQVKTMYGVVISACSLTKLSKCSFAGQATSCQHWADTGPLPQGRHSRSCNESVHQHTGVHGAQVFAELAAEEHSEHRQRQFVGVPPPAPLPPPPRHHSWRIFALGAVFAIVLQFVASWLAVSPVWERFFGRFVWTRGKQDAAAEQPPPFEANSESTALVLYSDSAESVEWVNMCWRKV